MERLKNPWVGRKEKYTELISEIKSELESRGVRPLNIFDRPEVINGLVYGILLMASNLVNNIRLIDDAIHNQNRKVIKFIRKYEGESRLRKKSSLNLVVGFPGLDRLGELLDVGYANDPNYEQKSLQFEESLAVYQRQVREVNEETRRLLEGEEGQIFQYVRNEDEKAKCSLCGGIGWHGTGQSGIGDVQCVSCGGSGGTGYLPQVTAEQRRIYENFKLPQKPSYPNPPQRELPVYIEL